MEVVGLGGRPKRQPRRATRAPGAPPAGGAGALPACGSERELQTRCADYLSAALPPGEAVFHHSPQEMCRGPDQGMWQSLRTSGFRTGWPDLEIVWRGRVYFVELKMPGNRPTAAQDDCHGRLRAAGAEVVVARSLEEMCDWLRLWGLPLRVGAEEYAGARAGGRMSAAAYRALGASRAPGNAIGKRGGR